MGLALVQQTAINFFRGVYSATTAFEGQFTGAGAGAGADARRQTQVRCSDNCLDDAALAAAIAKLSNKGSTVHGRLHDRPAAESRMAEPHQNTVRRLCSTVMEDIQKHLDAEFCN